MTFKKGDYVTGKEKPARYGITNHLGLYKVIETEGRPANLYIEVVDHIDFGCIGQRYWVIPSYFIAIDPHVWKLIIDVKGRGRD